MQNSQVLLHLSLIEDIGPSTVMRLMGAFLTKSVSLDIIYLLSVDELTKRAGLSRNCAQRLHAGLRNRAILETELALIDEYAITLITLADPTYPELLKQSAHPPTVLYVKGCMQEAKIGQPSHLAIVGSRKADAYGQKVIHSFVPEIVSKGYCVVSGGALGLDGMAHRATIESGGTTVAVLGSGLLKPYPKAHKELFKKLVEHGGALVSAFPLMMEPLPEFFPARNRIIAGLSHGCLVVQAGIPSGALITAQYALNEGREVFAVPGAIDNPVSVGCHKLLSQGATLATCAADIFSGLGALPTDQTRQRNIWDKGSEREQPQNTMLAPAQKIIQLCAQPQSFEDLKAYVGLEDALLHDVLFELSLDGQLLQNRVGLWSRY